VQGILHVQLGMGLWDSNSSKRIFKFIKNCVTFLSSCITECTSCSKSKIQKYSPFENLSLKSSQRQNQCRQHSQ